MTVPRATIRKIVIARGSYTGYTRSSMRSRLTAHHRTRPKKSQPLKRCEQASRFSSKSGAKITHDQADHAFYSRSQDSIHLPPKESFRDPAGYYGTALHELAHWTGHPSRLNRSTLNESYRFGDTNYAKEELRAELASVFMAAESGSP